MLAADYKRAHQLSERLVKLVASPEPRQCLEENHEFSSDDWQDFQYLAFMHGLSPLVYKKICGHQLQDAIDPRTFDYFKEQYRLNALRNNRVLTEVQELRTLAESSGVEIFFLKGSELIKGYYADPALRQMSDIDLYIAHPQFDLFDRLLQEKKYRSTLRCTRHLSYLSPDSRDVPVSFTGEHPDNPLTIELHSSLDTSFCTRFSNAYESLYRNLHTRHIALFAHVLLHAGDHIAHSDLRFVSLSDIAMLTPRLNSGDWAVFEKLAVSCAAESPLIAPLLLCSKYFPIGYPSNLERLLSPEISRRIKTSVATDFSRIHGTDDVFLRMSWQQNRNEKNNIFVEKLQSLSGGFIKKGLFALQKAGKVCCVRFFYTVFKTAAMRYSLSWKHYPKKLRVIYAIALVFGFNPCRRQLIKERER